MLTQTEESQVRGIRRLLRTIHPGGYHYVDWMTWKDAPGQKLFYAIATADKYYTSDVTLPGLARKVRANIKRGKPGNEFPIPQ